MKNISTLIIVFFTTTLFAQTHQIIKHNSEKFDVNLINTESNLIYYSLSSSSEKQKISKYAVAQINEKSNNISKIISDKINIDTKSDYKKVVILKESETIGLNKPQEITSFIGKVKGQSYYELNKMTENSLRQKAAVIGAPFIVMVSKDPENLKAIAFFY
jgi:hypothetical protein